MSLSDFEDEIKLRGEGFVTVGTARAGVVNMSAGGLAISDDESEGGRGETR